MPYLAHWGLSGYESMRLFFATDVHSSERCWAKFLRAAEFYDADILVLGGDMTGKALVPITDMGGGHYATELQGQRHEFTDAELDDWKSIIRDRGLYPIVVSSDEVEALQGDGDAREQRLREAVVDTVAEWMERADERLGRTGMRCFVCPGNDDPFQIDDVIRSSRHVQLAEGEHIELGNGYEMVSTGWTNPTPWNTYREESEAELARRIASVIETAGASPERLVFNLHCPPHNTVLDEAPVLNDDMSVVSRMQNHVGSTAVRDAIERVQPVLSLHGHIHEGRGAQRIGRTLAINPGSTYELGTLQGVLVELNGKRKLSGYRLTTG